MSDNVLELKSRPLEKRTFRNKPVDAYSKKDWLVMFMNIFNRIYGKDMFDNGLLEGFQGKIHMMSKGLELVFGKRDWSAEEFIRFLEEQCEESCRNGYEFKVFTFSKGYCDKRLSHYDCIYTEERKYDSLKSLVYHKYYQIRNDQKNDLIDILSYLNTNYVAMMYSFGLPLTHKYIQISKNKTFSEAKKILMETIKQEILIPHSSDPDLVKLYFQKVLTNSVLWGPYKNKEVLEKFHVPDNHVFDWRKDLEFLWKKFDLHKTPIWDEAEKNIYWEALPQVLNIFTKGLKRKNKKRKNGK